MSRFRSALAFALVATLLLATGAGEARPGSGGSFGSRGIAHLYAAGGYAHPPTPAAPVERSMTQPARPSGRSRSLPARPRLPGNRPASLAGCSPVCSALASFGLLFGQGLFGGLTGSRSIRGFVLQIALVVIVARLAPVLVAAAERPRRRRWASRCATPPHANSGTPYIWAAPAAPSSAGSGGEVKITPADFVTPLSGCSAR